MNHDLRFKILLRDNFICQYCGRKAPEVKLEIDHKIPLSKKGTNTPDNLVVACFECNRGKSWYSLDEKPVIKEKAIKIKDFKKIGVGQVCRKCGRITEKRKRVNLGEKIKKQSYYFNEYDWCRYCWGIYMIETSKVYV